MTISPRGLISGAAGLCLQYIAEIQEAEAKIQANFLKMFTTGAGGETGLLEMEGYSNKLGLDFANNQATDQEIQGWMQFGGALGQAGVGFGTLYLGSNAAADEEAGAKQLQGQLDELVPPPGTVRMNAALEENADPKEIEMTTFSGKQTSEAGETHAENEEVVEVTAQRNGNQAAGNREVETEKTSDRIKDLKEQIATKRQTAEAIKGRYQYFGQSAGQMISASAGVAGAYAGAAATRAQGQAGFAQGTARLYDTVIGLVNSAAASASSSEQGTVGLYSSIISLSGAARG